MNEPITIDYRRLQERVEKKAWVQWITNARDWKHFITLTYRNEVSREVALRDFSFLVRVLNRDLLGNHYTQKVGHSYFSYVIALEFQQRGCLHFHGIIDQPINYLKIHSVWNKINGFSWISQVKSRLSTVEYICKYISKGGDLIPYFQKKNLNFDELLFRKPLWWL